MRLKTILKFIEIKIQEKFNKKYQKVYVSPDQDNVLITSFSELYVMKYINKIAIDINEKLAEDKELLLLVIKYLIKNKKELILIETVRAFNDNDIEYLYSLSDKITLEQKYMDEEKEIAANQIFYIDIVNYNIISKKLDYFEKIANAYCKNDLEKVIFTAISLSNYITYINTSNFKNVSNPCLINAFLLKSGVCMDFSVAFWKCLDRLKINTVILKGQANKKIISNNIFFINHAWNQVEIDNYWYNIDLTWYDSSKDLKYFLVPDEIFYSEELHNTKSYKYKCKKNIERTTIQKIIEEFLGYKNVFKEYDKGNRKIQLNLINQFEKMDK